MAEQVQPLSLAEAEFVALAIRLRDEAKANADAQFAQRISVFHRQFNIAPNTPLAFESAIGPVPARLMYDASPSSFSSLSSQDPAESTAL